MRVKFENGPRRRDVPAIGKTVDRGEAVEVDAEIGEQLINQGWAKVARHTNPTAETVSKEK